MRRRTDRQTNSRTDTHTHTLRRPWPLYISRRLRLTHAKCNNSQPKIHGRLKCIAKLVGAAFSEGLHVTGNAYNNTTFLRNSTHRTSIMSVASHNDSDSKPRSMQSDVTLSAARCYYAAYRHNVTQIRKTILSSSAADRYLAIHWLSQCCRHTNSFGNAVNTGRWTAITVSTGP